MDTPRRFVAVPLLALVIVGAGAVGAAGAAPKPVVCKAGSGKLVLQGKARCVAFSALVTTAPPAPSAYARWVRFGLDRQLGRVLERRFVKPRFRGRIGVKAVGVVAGLRGRTVPLGTALDAALGVDSEPGARRLPRAVTTTTGPVTTAATATGTSAHGSIESRDSATGTTATLDVTGRTRKDAAGEVDPSVEIELGISVRTDGGKSYRMEVAIPVSVKLDLVEECPSATGVVRRKGGFKIRRTTREAKTLVGLDYINETINVTAKTSFTGQVDEDAKLKRIAYEVHVDLEHAFSASALRGLIRNTAVTRFVIDASGTLDPATGAVSSGTTSIDGTTRQVGRTRQQEQAAVAEALADPGVRGKLEEVVAAFLKSNFEALKKVEEHWQTPNACATLDLSPPTATLEEEQTQAVDGSVLAKSGEAAAGRWTTKTLTRGFVKTLPGTSSATAKIGLTVRGAAADDAGHAVDVTLRATSPAGIAERQWTADAADPTLYFRVTAASGTQTAAGTLVRPGTGCTMDVPSSGPWTYAFAATTGPPDGSLGTRAGTFGGILRASGTSVAPAITQSGSCLLTPRTREAITYTGQFGPAVGFAEVAGDPTSVELIWSTLSPPPLLDVEALGPDCRRRGSATGTPFSQIVPLATLRQRTPFTLGMSTPWTVDAIDLTGHVTCTGSVTQSVTVQRVSADGSPLP